MIDQKDSFSIKTLMLSKLRICNWVKKKSLLQQTLFFIASLPDALAPNALAKQRQQREN